MKPAMIRALAARGFTAEQIAAIAEVEHESKAAEREAAKLRKRESRARHAMSQDVTVTDVTSRDTPAPSASLSSFSPTPPHITLPSPPPPTSSLRSETIKSSDWPKDFREQFWINYPRKVGKKAAIRKVEIVHRNGEIAWSAFLAAVQRIAGSVDDPKFIPHPTTWLGQGRYLDGGTGPPGDPAYRPPPGAPSLQDILKAWKPNGTASGTQVRNDAGVGSNGANHGAELQLSGGSALRPQERGEARAPPDDLP